MTISNGKTKKRVERGFSLLELLVVLGVLGIVAGVAMSMTSQLIRTNSNVTNSVDLIQEGRQFMDQISSDIHQAGYPSATMFDPAGGTPATKQAIGVVNGLTSITATSMQFEGDVDASGQVSQVWLQLVVPAGGCPCTMQRGVVPKSVGGQPPFYTELTGVMNQDVFSAWEYDGSQVTLPATDISSLGNVKTVRVKLQVQSTHKDVANGTYSTTTLTTEAKLNNFTNVN